VVLVLDIQEEDHCFRFPLVSSMLVRWIFLCLFLT
jgi:hypothetical protein